MDEKVFCSGCGEKYVFRKDKKGDRIHFHHRKCKEKAYERGWLACSKCGSMDRRRRIRTKDHPGDNEVLCQKCVKEAIGRRFKFINWLKDKIAETCAKGKDRNRYVLRELIQNADDLRDPSATIVVIRFREKALDVANDGRHFTDYDIDSVTGEHIPGGDFQRINEIMKSGKEGDPETTGYHGTGFQTVFAITNHPEIHSHGKSYRLDPTVDQEDKSVLEIEGDSDDKQSSPYHGKGALFVFPWRTDEEAKRKYPDGIQHFESVDDWPRWNPEERREMFNDWKDYLRDVLLCCHNILRIRMIWEGRNRTEVFQTERDFSMSLSEVCKSSKVVSVTQGNGIVKGDGFDSSDWRWEKDNMCVYRYYWASKYVQDDDGWHVFLMKDSSTKDLVVRGEKKAPEDVSSVFLKKRAVEQRSDVHILFPMFKRLQRHGGADVSSSFVYSVLPIPKRGGTFFTCSAHLFIKQDRTDIDVHGVKGKWFHFTLKTLARLYIDGFKEFTAVIHKDSQVPEDDKQEIILDNLPPKEIHEWFDIESFRMEGKEMGPFWHDESRNLRRSLLNIAAVRYRKKWYTPNSLELPPSQRERVLLEYMGVPHVLEPVESHAMFKSTLEEELQGNILKPGKFIGYWNDFKKKNEDPQGNLVYLQSLKEGANLDRVFAEALIGYCFNPSNIEEMSTLTKLPIIPNCHGTLCSRNQLRVPPKDREILKVLIPNQLRCHEDVESLAQNYIQIEASPEDLFIGIGEKKEDVEKDPEPVWVLYDYLEDRDLRNTKLADYSLVLDEDGKLHRPGEVKWAPSIFYDDTRRLFKESGINVSWVNRDVLLRHKNLITKLHLARPDYLSLLELRNWDGKSKKKQAEQKLIFEGLTNSGYEPEDIEEIPFLPSDGRLRLPKRCLHGKVEGLKFESFLGVIDRHIYDFIEDMDEEEKRNTLDLLESAGLGEKTPKNMLLMLSKLAKDDEDRFKDISSSDHKMISALLLHVCRKRGFKMSEELYDARFLPAKYRGRIVVCPPPRYVGKPPHVEDVYQRDWVFALHVGTLPGMTKEIEENIRWLHLAKGIDNKPIERAFEPVRLMEKGVPRMYVLLFLTKKKDDSLFEDDVLTDLLGIANEDELRRQKKVMLDTLRHYLGKGGRGEWTDNKGADVPCLYDTEEVWRPAKEFALEVDAELEVLGKKALHPQLMPPNMDVSTLKAIGVFQHPDSESMTNRIKKWAEEGNRLNLTTALVYMLTSKEKVGIRREDLKDQNGEDLKWVPVLNEDLGLLSAQEALISLRTRERKLEEVFGEDYDKLFSWRLAPRRVQSCANERTEKLKKDGFDSKRISEIVDSHARDLGLRTDPTIEELVRKIKECAGKGEPPTLLFDEITAKLQREEVWDLTADDFRELPYYHTQRGWVSSDRILLIDRENVPECMQEDFVFLKESGHYDYLSRIGSRDSLSSVDVLNWMACPESQDRIDEAIWRWLYSRQEELHEADLEPFSDCSIFLSEETQGRTWKPNMMFFCDDVMNEIGRFGRYLMVDRGDNERRLLLLEGLGVRDVTVIEEKEMKDLLLNIKKESAERSFIAARRLLYLMATKGYALPARAIMPALMGTEDKWASPSRCYLPDHESFRHFEDEIPIISFGPPKGLSVLRWNEWLMQNTVRSVKSELTTNFEQPEDPQRDYDQEIRFREMPRALVLLLEDIGGGASGNLQGLFDWMSNLEIWRTSWLDVEYTIGGRKKRVPEGFHLYGDSSRLYLAREAPSRIYHDLAKMILERSRMGFSDAFQDVEENSMVSTISNLLARNLEDWHVYAKGYVLPEDLRLPPEMIEEIEFDDYEAYHTLRQEFRRMYGCCQICGIKTPLNDEGESCERMKSIISRRGGRYRAPVEIGNKSNYLWLCPTHYTLYERAIVKIPQLEYEEPRDVVDALRTFQKHVEKATKKLKKNKILAFEFCAVSTQRRRMSERKKRMITETEEENETYFTKEHIKMVINNLMRAYAKLANER